MHIRKANNNDINQILTVYAKARQYMKESGNAAQWGDSYPSQQLIEEDIVNGYCYVGLYDGLICCVFALIPGEDPTYVHIEGAWVNDEEYSSIHRIASDGSRKGVFEKCIAYCKNVSKNIKIDTHENNLTIQHLLEKNGFAKCGIIYLKNGEPRIAYQLV